MLPALNRAVRRTTDSEEHIVMLPSGTEPAKALPLTAPGVAVRRNRGTV